MPAKSPTDLTTSRNRALEIGADASKFAEPVVPESSDYKDPPFPVQQGPIPPVPKPFK